MVFQKLLKTVNQQREADREAQAYQNLIRQEAKIGGTLFGPIPAGHRREFFCLNEHTWVWYEEWRDHAGQKRSKSTRYDIRPNGVVKIQDGHPSQYVSLDEGRNLYKAMSLYNQRIDAELAARS